MPPHGKRPKGMTVRLPLNPLPFRFGFSNGTLGSGRVAREDARPPRFLSGNGDSAFVRRNRELIGSPCPAGSYGSSEESLATVFRKTSGQMV